MEPAEQIQTISELAIAMAGFAGVVFVLTDSAKTPVGLFRVTNLLALSFATMSIALLSLSYEGFGFTLLPDFRFGSALFFLGIGVITSAYSLPTYYRLNIPARSSVTRIIALTAVPLLIADLIVSLLNAIGLFGGYAPQVFVLILSIMLMICAVQFLAAVADTYRSDPP